MATVLIIDPESKECAPLREALENAGMGVVVVADGTAGLERAHSLLPTCILLCVELPGASGYALCNKLKKDSRLSLIPLVLASTHASVATFEEHARLRTHADAYLHKPYVLADVLAKLAPFLPEAGLVPKAQPASEMNAGHDRQKPVVEGVMQSQAEENYRHSNSAAAQDDTAWPGSSDDDDSPPMSSDAEILLENAVDMSSSTQVLRMSDMLPSQAAASAAKTGPRDPATLIGEVLKDLDRRAVDGQPAADETQVTHHAVSAKLELPMEPTPVHRKDSNEDGRSHDLGDDAAAPFASARAAMWQHEDADSGQSGLDALRAQVADLARQLAASKKDVDLDEREQRVNIAESSLTAARERIKFLETQTERQAAELAHAQGQLAERAASIDTAREAIVRMRQAAQRAADASSKALEAWQNLEA